MLSIEEVIMFYLTSDIKLVSYSSTITMMHGPIYIRFRYSVSTLFYLTGKIHLIIGHEGTDGDRAIALPFNLGSRWGGCSTSRPSRFTPGKEPVPILYEAGWTPGSFWMGEKIHPHGGLSPEPSSP